MWGGTKNMSLYNSSKWVKQQHPKLWKMNAFIFNLNLNSCVLSCCSHVWLFVTLWAVASQAPLSMGFSRQEYWSGLPFPPPGDLLDPGIKPKSPALQVDSLLLSPWRRIYISLFYIKNLGLWDFPSGLVVENLSANAGVTGLIHGLGSSHIPQRS